MNIQLFGHKGMLGKEVFKAALKRGHSLRIDAAQRIESVAFTDIHSDTVINCAGVVKQSTAKKDQFILANSYGPVHLATCCDKVGARLIHVSTDCIFGERNGPHNEYSEPTPLGIYALTKLLGEVSTPPHLTIRTSFVGFGTHGLIKELLSDSTVEASDFLLWSGHTARVIADLLITLAERRDINGILHIPGEYQSRFTLVNKLLHWLNLSKDSTVILNNFSADRRLRSVRYGGLDLPQLPAFDDQLSAWKLEL